MNEPVAWIIDVKMKDCDDNFIWNTGDYPDWQVKDWIPLYTHPVKELTDELNQLLYSVNGDAYLGKEKEEELVKIVRKQYTKPVKELTDEEIYRLLADSIWAVGLNTDCLDEQNWADGITVARAILRKAQEK